MSKLITGYLKRSCSAPLSTEETTSLSTVETSSSSSHQTESEVQTSRAIHINEQKSTNENNESIPVQCQPGPSNVTIWKEKTQLPSLLVQELFLASLFQRKGVSFLYILHKALREIDSRS